MAEGCLGEVGDFDIPTFAMVRNKVPVPTDHRFRVFFCFPKEIFPRF
jgi:hypothetical protein